MGRVVAQDPALMDRVMAVAVLAPGSKVIKAIRVATINSQVRVISSSNPVIRATRRS